MIFLTNEAANEQVERAILRLAFGGEVQFPPAAAAEVPEATLDRYAGTYRLPSGADLVVLVRNGRLMVQATDLEAAALFVPFPRPGPDAGRRFSRISRAGPRPSSMPWRRATQDRSGTRT